MQPARDVLALVSAFTHLGCSRDALIEATGIDARTLEDPDARVPCIAVGALVEVAYRQRPAANLGLKSAVATPLGSYPLIDYLVLSSDSVAAGYGMLARYFHVVSPFPLEIFDDESPVRVVMTGTPHPFVAEYSLSLGLLHFGRETGGRFKADSVSFVHRPDDEEEFRRVLGCEIRGEAGWNGIAIPQAAWKTPLSRRDPILRRMLEGQADRIDPPRPGALSATAEVRRWMMSRLAERDSGIERAARSLGTTPRTLQRRLAAEGTRYQSVGESVRREAAEGYLTDTSLSAGEVAYLLGYSEPAAFHRAFRRWEGMTPADFRRGRRKAGGRPEI